MQVVTDYISGATWMLTTAALAALPDRPDRDEALAPALNTIRHLRPWPVYYALRFFDSLDHPPAAGSLALLAPEWWAEHPMIPAWLAESFAGRRGSGEAPGFGTQLSIATPMDIAIADLLLRKVSDPWAHELLDLLALFRLSALDRGYLQTVGR